VCYGQPSFKNSKNQGIYLVRNTLLGLNELKYSVPSVNVFVHISSSYRTSTSSEPTKTVQRFSSLTTVWSSIDPWCSLNFSWVSCLKLQQLLLLSEVQLKLLYYWGINSDKLWARSTLIHSVRAACYGLYRSPDFCCCWALVVHNTQISNLKVFYN
jgi:hypothetical protein